MIGVRGGFSESNGMNKLCMEMQLTEFNERTRVILQNTLFNLLSYYFDREGGFDACRTSRWSALSSDFCEDLLSNVFTQKTLLEKGYSYSWNEVYKEYISRVFDFAPYNEVLDVILYCYKWMSRNYYSASEVFERKFNEVFEREYVGYRFVCGAIEQITDKIEISEMEKAYDVSFNSFEGSRSHIKKAFRFLSDRDTHDYKNCIKESISAVEAICKIIIKDDKSELNKALKKLKEKGLNIHPALEQAWIKLYAYTCDEGGIRHSEKAFESEVTFEEAKYMLVSCCAFVNYLIAEYGKIK